MRSMFRALFRVRYAYINPLQRQRAASLIIMSGAALLAWAAYFSLILIPGILQGTTFELTILIPVLAFPVFIGLIYNFVQNGRLTIALWLFIGLLLVSIVPFSVFTFTNTLPIFLLIPLVAAGVLLDRRALVVLVVLVLVSLLLRAAVQAGDSSVVRYIPSQNATLEFLLMTFVVVTLGAFLSLFGGSAERLSQVSLEDIEHLRATSSFSTAGRGDENAVIADLLSLIQVKLGYSLAQLFIVDETGALLRRVRLGISERDLIISTTANPADEPLLAEVAAKREPVFISILESALAGHLVAPAVRSLSLPVQVGDRLFGVLDIQSASEEPFTTNQVAAFAQLAETFAGGLAQVQLESDLRRTLREQEEVLARLRSQLVEIEGRSRQTVSSGWRQYLEGRAASVYGYNMPQPQGGIIPAADLPPAIAKALSYEGVHVDARDDAQIVSAAIRFRGEVLGAMSFTLPATPPISERQLEMVRAIADRLGVALENGRLFEQIQAQALRERKATEVASTLLSANDLETLLSTAAETFYETLGAVNARIHLEPRALAASAAAGSGEAS
ncbi:MAG: GAF domain-containing protein [Aggregatilineales bacterium]